MNKIVISGNTGDEVKKITDKMAKVVIAVKNDWFDKIKNEWINSTLWFEVLLFGNMANRKIEKGSTCIISGKLNINKWEKKDGAKVETYNIIADSLEVLKRKEQAPQNAFDRKRAETGRTHEQQKQDYADNSESNLPF